MTVQDAAPGVPGVMLTVRQAAERAAVSAGLVYAWCAEGSLPHSRVGRMGRRGHIRIAAADLDDLLDRLRVRGKNPLALRHIDLT